MSNTRTKSQLASMSAAEPETARRASTSRVRISISRPSLSRTRCEELPAVLGDAARFRGDEARTAHFGAAELGRANLQRIQRARHGWLRKAPRLADAFAETNDAREGIDDAEAPP